MKFLLQRACWALGPLVAVLAVPAHAVDQVTLTVSRLQTPQVQVRGAQVVMRLGSGGLSGSLSAASVQLSRPGAPPLRAAVLHCAAIGLSGRYACRGGHFALRAGAFGALQGNLTTSYDAQTGALTVSAARVALAHGEVRLGAALRPGQWQLQMSAEGVQLAEAVRLAHPWFTLPAGDSLSGPVSLALRATNRPALQARIRLRSADLNFSNAAGTVVSQHVAAALRGAVAERGGALSGTLVLTGSRGEALAGPLYLDLAAHPLALRLTAARRGAGPLEISHLVLHERGVIDANATAQLALTPRPTLIAAQVRLARLTFPGAYASFMQMTLASGPLGSLRTRGWASGSLQLRAGHLERIDALLHGIGFSDPTASLSIAGLNGAIHWASASGVAVAHSQLSWQRIGLYGLAGGATHLTFLTWSRNFALLGGNVRVPVFDGAILIHTLVGRNLGTPHAQFDFNADLTPISMPVMCKAFGWPIMNGQLFAHIPLVQYRHHVLKFNGNLVAHVFDGVITGSHIHLDDPLGQWPQLYADVTARALDLGMVTRTFAFGSMTGRIDADITGLKLFDWSPVAFDARIYTMPGDHSSHLISQKAVTRIAGLGGGGGEVAAALESGVLQFFKTFHYRRLAIGCYLHNEVCHMSGVGPADDGGYYLVQGSWIPRLDIIGNVQRVNWPQMLEQIKQGISSGGMKVN
ncbi:MAG: hypothetical protein ACP5P4_03205 [Steroidobacteraceae bacterium]